MPTKSSSMRAVALVLACAAPAIAGDLNNWRTLALPPGAQGFNAIGTTVSFQTPTEVHLYSGITKEWTVVPVSNLTFFEQYNAYAVLQDGNQIHGFSSRTGAVDTITASPGALIVSGPISSSWVTLVADGLQAWGFSGFRGKWVPLTLSQPQPAMVTNRLCGLLLDGNTAYGFSAHWGTFVPVAADAQTTLAVNEEVGTAHSPGMFRGFSVHQNTWGTQAFDTTSGSFLNEGFAMAVSGSSLLAFSGLTGTLASYQASGPPAPLFSNAMVAAFQDGTTAVCYGAGQGAFAATAAPGGFPFLDYEFVLVQDPTGVTPFSSITGTYGPKLAGSYTLLTNDVIAYADAAGAGTDYAYTPIRNEWVAVPPVSPIGSPALVRSAVVVPHSTGYVALSARHGTWVSQTTVLTGIFEAPANSGTILISEAGGDYYVFDARLNRFAFQEAANGSMTHDISRHTVMAFDGVQGFGFGQPTGRWDAVDLLAPVITLDVASSIGFIETTQYLHVYSVNGSLSYEGRFPEFSRAMKLGNRLRLHQVAPAGSALVMLVGVAPAYIDLGPLHGILHVDPAVLLNLPLSVPVPAGGLLDIEIPLPQHPVLVGLQPQIQNIVLPPAEPAYLSSSVAPVLY